MKLNYLIFAAFLGFALVSCGEDFDCETLEANIGASCDDGDANTENDTVTADCACVGTAIVVPPTYTNSVKAIFDASCAVAASCHGTGSAIFELTNYAQVSGAVGFGRILPAMKYEAGFSPMPPAGMLPEDVIQTVETWINDGTPE